MRNLIILIAVLTLGYLLVKWFTRTPSKQVARTLRQYGLYGVIALVVFFVVTGRMHWLYGIIAGLIPVAQRLFTAWRTVNYFRSFGRGNQNSSTTNTASGQSSTIETKYLSMSLNHDTGEMTGTVLLGRYKGHTLSELSLDELIKLLKVCRLDRDTDSVAVLESYLDRYHSNEDADNWRDQYKQTHTNHSYAAENNNNMEAEEAYQILGLQQGASKQDIKDAHRRLMQKFHPDRGGSTYLSVKINRAKDYLINNL